MNQEEYDFERSYWGNCCNTFDEEQKHYVYGRLMDLKLAHFSFDVENKSVLDLGGGPVSMLLKTNNLKKGKVVDPIEYPNWTIQRYAAQNIEVLVDKAENIDETGWDEVWIYNCLQHVDDPKKIIDNAKKAAPVLRIFEWINVPAHDGHPHELTDQTLNQWIGQPGRTINLAQTGCFGQAYYGVFNV